MLRPVYALPPVSILHGRSTTAFNGLVLKVVLGIRAVQNGENRRELFKRLHRKPHRLILHRDHYQVLIGSGADARSPTADFRHGQSLARQLTGVEPIEFEDVVVTPRRTGLYLRTALMLCEPCAIR